MIPQPRAIKSFVLRQGRMTAKQKAAYEQGWQQYGLSLNQGQEMINLEKVFERTAETVLEIGFGMGHSLIEQAKMHPDKNFIGVEVHTPGIGALLAELSLHDIQNVRVFNADVNHVLNIIENESLDRIQIFFPDPWPKRKHHKRRLIQPVFVELLCGKLKTGGQLHLATDWEDYAMQMMKVLSGCASLKNVAGKEQFIMNDGLRPSTKFEKRGAKLGHGIWDLLFQKLTEE